MKNLIRIFFCVALLTASLYAQQNTLAATTLSAAVGLSDTSVTVASATGITAPSGNTQTLLYIDREAMYVTTVSGTTIGVVRGASGTRATKHVSAAVVLSGRPAWFYSDDPQGACTAANTFATPYVNIVDGNQWLCSTVTLQWVPGWGNAGTSSQPIGPTAAVASAAGKITPSGPLFHVTGTAAITGFNIPVGYNGGPFCIIPDGAFTTTNANNIAIASTGVASKQLCYSYDSNAAKPFFPSY